MTLIIKKKWTFDAALNKNKYIDDFKTLKLRRVFDNKEKNEMCVNVWRKTKDHLGRVYLWNIVTMETKWPDEKINTLSNIRFSYCDIESIHNNKLFKEKRMQNNIPGS